MKLLKFFSISFIVFFSLLLATSVSAATTPPTTSVGKTTPTKAIVLATVNIQNAKIVSQKGNVFNITFSLSNREGLQTGVKYGIRLIQEAKTGNSIVDEKIYDESLTLNPNSTIKKEITYTAPPYLTGTYTIVITSNNSSNFPFGISTIGKVDLKATALGIQILPETCFSQVVGNKSGTKYPLEGDVLLKEANDTLMLTCTALNSSEFNILVTPQYVTRYRSSYGDKVEQVGGSTEAISFNAKEKKAFSVVLPKASVPQLYNVTLTLANNNLVSNPIDVHYVISGPSATIQNLSLDKDYYERGEQAKISFYYVLSGVSSPASMSIKITNSTGKSCATPVNKDLPSDKISSLINIPVSITSNCQNPQIVLSLTDSKGTVLDQKTFNIKTTSKTTSNNMSYIIIILVLAVIIIVYIYIKRKNIFPTNDNSSSGNPSQPSGGVPMNIIFPFLLLVALLGFIPTNKASADTWEFMGNYFTVDLNQSVYNPGEFMSINGLIANIDGEPSMMHMDISFFSPDTYGPVPSPWLWVDKVRGENDITHLYPDALSAEIQRSAPTANGSYGIGIIMYVDKYEVDGNGNVTPNYVEYVAYPSTFYTVEDATCINGATNYPTCTKSCPDGSTTATNGECPVVPPTVTVTANSVNPLTIPYNNQVYIRWTSHYATSCTCTFGPSNESCGSGPSYAGTGIEAPGNPYTLTETKTFSVTCIN